MDTLESLILLLPLAFVTVVMTVFVLVEMQGFGVERSYYEELQSCQDELQVATAPSCAPCECSPGFTGIVWTVLGFLLLAASYFWVWYNNKKAEQIVADAEKKAEKIVKDAERCLK